MEKLKLSKWDRSAVNDFLWDTARNLRLIGPLIEDSNGIFALNVRRDHVGADGDYAPLRIDSSGNLLVKCESCNV